MVTEMSTKMTTKIRETLNRTISNKPNDVIGVKNMTKGNEATKTFVVDGRDNTIGTKWSNISVIAFVVFGVVLSCMVVLVLTITILCLIIRGQDSGKRAQNESTPAPVVSTSNDTADLKEMELTIRFSPLVSRSQAKATVKPIISNNQSNNEGKQKDDVVYSLPLAKHLRKPPGEKDADKGPRYSNLPFRSSTSSTGGNNETVSRKDRKESIYLAMEPLHESRVASEETENINTSSDA